MATDPILTAADLRPPGTSGSSKEIANVLWKLTRELFPNIVTLSLARNDFKSLVPIVTLPEFLPRLRNLSLQGNDLKWTKDLGALASRKGFDSLQELVLIDNPVQVNAVAAGNEAGYRAEVLAKFPSLTMLDMKPVETSEAELAKLPGAKNAAAQQANSFAGVTPIPFPLAIKAGFSDDSAQQIIPTFLSNYFGHMDSERTRLRQVYAPSAMMTFNVIWAAPPRAKAEGFLFSMKNQRSLKDDRLRALGTHDVMKRGTHSSLRGTHVGPDSILTFLKALPKSKHPLTEATKFVVDAWVLPNDKMAAISDRNDRNNSRPAALLFINVHGEYAEPPTDGVRSFDRTFAVAPAAPDSPAAVAGWPCVILNEQFTIRQYAGSRAWSTDAAPMAAPSGSNGIVSTNRQSRHLFYGAPSDFMFFSSFADAPTRRNGAATVCANEHDPRFLDAMSGAERMEL